MNLPIKVAIIAISLCSSSVARADARLQVEIVSAKSGGSETSIALKLVNVGDQGAVVDKFSLPRVNGRGMMLDDPFLVKQQDGREAEFFGIMGDSMPRTPETLSIPAGGTFSLDIELAKSYRLSPGMSYKVGLRAPISYRSGEGGIGSAKSSHLKSSEWIGVYPSARTIVVPVTSKTIGRAAPDGILEPVACTDPTGTPAAQQKGAIFQSVLAGVTNGTGIALSQLQKMTQFDTSSAPDLWLRFSPSVHYRRYFGEHGPDVNISTGGVVNEDDALVDNTLLAILWRISGDGVTAKPPVSLSCRCNANEVPEGLIAYVQSGAPYVIHTCPVFWSLPMLPANHIEESSKIGTMVHEFTHFTDSKGLALRHPEVQGKDVASLSYAMELAADSQPGAVRFPNAYKFFVLGQVHGLSPQE